MKKYAFWIVLAVVIVAAGAWYWWKNKPLPAAEKKDSAPDPKINSGGGGSYQAPAPNVFTTLANWNTYKDVALKKGSSGTAVKLLQMVINKLYPGKYNLVEDGQYGDKTSAAFHSINSTLSLVKQSILSVGGLSLKNLDSALDGEIKKLFT